jgi:hypothetical protein
MKTTPQQHEEERFAFDFSPLSAAQTDGPVRDIRVCNIVDREGRMCESWARFCAVLGAALWAVIAVLAKIGIARIGQIELLFLFAPLVIVPLGMELGNAIVTTSLATFSRSVRSFAKVAQMLQPVGATFAVWALCLPPGRRAATLAGPWMLVCALTAFGGLSNLFRLRHANANWRVSLALALAQIDLAVGGAWLVASRLGIKPMGIQEPIGLLTAVHFHYAGFGTATIAAALLKSAASRSEQNRDYSWLNRIVLAVISLPYLVAVGFVISPILKMTAAVLFSGSVVVLAVFLRTLSRRLENFAARTLLQVSSAAIFAGMLFPGAYAVANFLGSDAPTIPQMARTHGSLTRWDSAYAGFWGG